LSQASPEVTFLAYPVTHADLKNEDLARRSRGAADTVYVEYAKYSLAQLRNWSGAKSRQRIARRCLGERQPVTSKPELIFPAVLRFSDCSTMV
jgi:hypothetical protein